MCFRHQLQIKQMVLFLQIFPLIKYQVKILSQNYKHESLLILVYLIPNIDAILSGFQSIKEIKISNNFQYYFIYY